MEDATIAITLGTCNSRLSHSSPGAFSLIPDSSSRLSIPTYIAFTASGVLFGHAAKAQFPSNPLNTVYDFTKLLGKKYSACAVSEDFTAFTYKLAQGAHDSVLVVVTCEGQEKRYTVEEICGLFVGYLRCAAEMSLARAVTSAIIAVPGIFQDTQRIAIKDSAAVAGLSVLRLINEATASAIAYDLGGDLCPTERYAVIADIGGSGMRVTVEAIEDGVYEMRDSYQSAAISGRAIDRRIAKYCVQVAGGNYDMRTLQTVCEAAKVALSTSHQAEVMLGSVSVGITRTQFDQLNADMYRDAGKLIARALGNTPAAKTDVKAVLCGGCMRIPGLFRACYDAFLGSDVYAYINPEETVVRGVAKQVELMFRPPSIPLICTFEMCALSLGVQTFTGGMCPVIRRGSTIPTTQTLLFTTCVDYQTSADIHIYEGERLFARDNHYRMSLRLEGMVPRPKGFADIEITFELDVEKVLSVTAIDAFSRISVKTSLAQDYLWRTSEAYEEMLNAALLYEVQDKQALLLSYWSPQYAVSAIRRKVPMLAN